LGSAENYVGFYVGLLILSIYVVFSSN